MVADLQIVEESTIALDGGLLSPSATHTVIKSCDNMFFQTYDSSGFQTMPQKNVQAVSWRLQVRVLTGSLRELLSSCIRNRPISPSFGCVLSSLEAA